VPRTLKNLLMSLFTAGVVLGGTELLLNLLDWPPPSIYVDGHRPIWTLHPDVDLELRHHELERDFSVHVSGVGFRGPEPVAPRIACLGDSTTFGWGVREEEAWPALLGEQLGVEVLNAGVPGYSSYQGLATLDRVLALKPDVVVLAYMIRDADPASLPDSEQIDPGPANPLQIQRALVSLLPTPAPAPPAGETQRVPPIAYAANVDALVRRVEGSGAQALLLSFPVQEARSEHQAVLAERGALSPELPAQAFFELDPIHLNVEGNQMLAQWLAAELARPSAPPAEPGED
jgi:lysophospholipase L1-like esterase